MAGTSTVASTETQRPPYTPTSRARSASRFGSAAFVVPLGGGLGAWIVSLTQLHLGSVGLYGLLASAGPLFFLGITLVIAGFAVEVTRIRPRQWVLGLHVAAMVVIIHATVPLLSHAPEWQWVYKHVGIAQTLSSNGRVTNPNNIYQEWPALFAAIGGISSESGVGLFALARWAPIAFELLDCLVLFAVFRAFTRDARVSILAVAIFEVIVTWVGQDYLSPQAFAYLLWLGFVFIMVRWLLVAEPRYGRGRLARAQARLRRGIQLAHTSDAAMRPVAVAVALCIFAAIVVAHQLTPYIGLVALAALTLLDLVRPRWLIAAAAVMTIGFLIPRYHLIAAQYGGLLSSFNFFQNATGKIGLNASAAEAFTANSVRILAVGVWLITVALCIRAWRAPGRLLVPAVLAFSPFVVLSGNAYGGEAIYRVFMFSAPWCALLAAQAICRCRLAAVRFAATALGLGVAVLLAMQGLYGPVAVDTFSDAEVNASLWLYGHVPSGSALILAANNFPVSEVANSGRDKLTQLPADPQNDANYINAASLTAVDNWVAGLRNPHSYLVFSQSMDVYAKFFGAPAGLGVLKTKVSTAPEWRLTYQNGGVRVYRFIG